MPLVRVLPVALVSVPLLLTGCASQSLVTADAQLLSDADAAYLKVDRTMVSGYRPELNAVYPMEGGTLVRSESFKDYYRIKVKPGLYRVQLKVYSGNYQPAFPVVPVNARAGKTYLFTASTVMNGKAVSAEFKEVSTVSDVTPNH